MSEPCAMPEPQAEHKMLLQGVGNWNVAGKFYMDPSQPPMESTGKEVVEALGAFWVVGHYSSEFMGMPFNGVSKMGYLPAEGCYVSTWIDSMMPFLFVLKGKMEADGKTLVLKGDGPNFMTGEGTIPHKMTTVFDGPDRHVMAMYAEAPGMGEIKMMEMIYTRA
ncbi:MAG: DUF1579 domain-containing protein [Planctomycetes bacterium]|nr:DUF1579 domain-containing protein [Planctomycetota bacterium]